MKEEKSCRFFLKNECKEGEKCPLPHVNNGTPDNICRFFLEDRCTFGASCLYEHRRPFSEVEAPVVDNNNAPYTCSVCNQSDIPSPNNIYKFMTSCDHVLCKGCSGITLKYQENNCPVSKDCSPSSIVLKTDHHMGHEEKKSLIDIRKKMLSEIDCKYGKRCKYGNICLYRHQASQTGSQQSIIESGVRCQTQGSLHKQETKQGPLQISMDCRYGPNCRNQNCLYKHQETQQGPLQISMDCRYGPNCRNQNCLYKHQETQQGPLQSSQDCRYGSKCRNQGCLYKHQETQQGPWQSSMDCRYGSNCRNQGCLYKHQETQQGQKNCFEVLEHPAYSPDLAPSDYFLFGLLKKELEGRRFDSDEDVQKVVQDFFHTLPKSAYKKGIYKLPERWRRCIESQAARRNLPRSSSPYPGRGRPMTRRRYSRSPDRTPSRSPHRDVQEN
ncbi:hypothetical protein LAZ67_22001483 [Cordylochernes scorpioides]|uniref:Uncharacterized protein n=1 Tax=Cordylochernes scorpioides TaxID=51811 RepID=A0ABY6LP19_9ARAC|nr:hypothetical protein LAZ67_22001483 [Cordylochernes scorpioides]